MAFKASLSVLVGCQFGSATRLLSAAERGDDAAVQQVIRDKPFLAAFTGFHGTTSPLHRAAAAGHLGVCRAIIEPLKARVRDAEGGGARRGGTPNAGAAAKWHRLLGTVLNQRSHKSLTPLMLACEHGHVGVAAYLLREGADPLAVDFAHSRTCLHYAAVGGHADCLRLLLSDSARVQGPEGMRPLCDVIVQDVQVQACRYVDQRAYGGLTALHFAVVTGNLEAVQALLRAGASIMVKSDGEAYIGDDHLVPGSTPLHVAVIINSISIVHAILQAHMEMINILGTRLDERGRRPWEGTSRTDIRSVRNQFRKLPFHLARERQQPQLMSLVDPRIPIDVALDAARDTDHGIGPKRLGTICSLVLQRSLLQWLDNCQSQLAAEKAAAAAAAAGDKFVRQPSAVQVALAAVRGKRLGVKPPRPERPASASQPGSAQVSARPSSEVMPSPHALRGEGGAEAAAAELEAAAAALPAAATDSPFAALAAAEMAEVPSPAVGRLPLSASAPVTPARDLATLGQQASMPLTSGAIPMLHGEVAEGGEGSLQRMASLHGYMGMLSLKHPRSTRSTDALQRMQAAGALGRGAPLRQLSIGAAQQLAHTSSGSAASTQAAARVRFLSEPGVAAADAVAMAGARGASSPPDSPREIAGVGPSPSLLQPLQGNTITIKPHRRSSSQNNARLGAMLQRLRSGDLTPQGPEGLAAAPDGVPAAAVAALLGEKQSEKDLGLDSEGEVSASEAEDDGEDVECGVCLDAAVDVAFASCQHKLCLECARNLTRQDKKPPHCPFCRRLVVGFQRVSAAGMPLQGDGVRSASRLHAHRGASPHAVAAA